MSVVAKKIQSTASPQRTSAPDRLSLRLNRLDRYIAGNMVLLIVFSAFAVAMRESYLVSIYFGLASCLNGLHFVALKRKWFHRHTLTCSFLGSTLLVLLLLSQVSSSAMIWSTFFLPVVCLAASQLLGFARAIPWYAAILLVTFLSVQSGPAFDPETTGQISVLSTVISMVVAFAIMWLSGEAENYERDRSNEFERQAETLRENARLLHLAEVTAAVGHWQWHIQRNEVTFSNEFQRILGVPEGQALTIKGFLRLFDRSHRWSMRESFEHAGATGDGFDLSITIGRGTEDERYMTVRGFGEADEQGNIGSVFGVIRDDTAMTRTTQELAKTSKDLRKLASYDPLTGLANRFAFRRQLHYAVRRSIKNDRPVALLIVDMDGFKEINDTLGHAVGDKVLQETANRICNVVQGETMIARLGGDEFTIIVDDPRSTSELMALGDAIVGAVLEPLNVDGHQVMVGASVGASQCPLDSKKPDELFTFAGTAMNTAKRGTRNVVAYEPSMTELLQRRKRVESKLAAALSRNEFHLVYQPQVSVDSLQIKGFEALVRWGHEGKTVSPAEFIPLLESSGRIVEVGNWILNEACRQAGHWRRMGFDFTMAVNVSPIQFMEPDFIPSVLRALQENDLPASFFDVEITESMLVSDVDVVSSKLEQLQATGIKISIDDFGTGYSSLAYLKNFPIDCLKIDQAFIRDIPKYDDGVIATSIIVLGQSLDLEVLAEGVETEAQYNFLKANLCDSFQGHLFSEAIAPEVCEQLLLEQQAESNSKSLMCIE